MKIYISFFFYLFTLSFACAQQDSVVIDSMDLAFEKEYKRRITKKYLYGKYIPKDLIEACKELSKLADPRGIEKMKSASEEDVVKKLHFGLGKWISHNWGFYKGSRYSHYLKGEGLSYPDDMIDITIRMWHRHLMGIKFGFATEVKRVVSKREEEWVKKQKENLIYEGPKSK